MIALLSHSRADPVFIDYSIEPSACPCDNTHTPTALISGGHASSIHKRSSAQTGLHGWPNVLF